MSSSVLGMSLKARRIFGRTLSYVVLVCLGIVGIAPFVYLAILSTKRRIDILSQVPPKLTFDWAVVKDTYQEVLKDQGMQSFVWKSVHQQRMHFHDFGLGAVVVWRKQF